MLSPTEVVIDGRRTLMCGSNNYFGLSFHPDVIAAAHAALDRDGAGTTGSRAANGTYAAPSPARSRRSPTLYGKRHALVFTTGYQANLGVISGLCGADDTVLLDIESHASIYDGARLSGAQMFAFRHNSAADLRAQAGTTARSGRRCLVVVEGLYSISGDVAPLAEIVAVCRAAGAYADGRRGALVRRLRRARPRLRRSAGRARPTSTSSSARSRRRWPASAATASRITPALKLLHFAARPYVFTASGSPANIAGVEAALQILQRDTRAARRGCGRTSGACAPG